MPLATAFKLRLKSASFDKILQKLRNVMTEYDKNLKRLKTIFKDIEPNKKTLVMPLLESCSYIEVKLKELEAQINAEGFTEMCERGSKTSAASVSYLKFLQSYHSAIRQLIALCPAKTEKSKLEMFLNGKREN